MSGPDDGLNEPTDHVNEPTDHVNEPADDLNGLADGFDEPTGRPETVVFKVYFEKAPEFTITYNHKEDLFKSFKDELDKWSSADGTTYWIESHGDKVKVDDADALLGIANDATQTVKVTVCEEAGDADSYAEYGETIEKRKKKKGHRTDHGRHHSRGEGHCHSHSQCGGPSHSRDSSDEEHFHECYGQCPPYYEPSNPPFLYRPPYMPPPMCCPCNPFHFPMDPRFGNYPFFAMGRGRGGYHPHGGVRGNFHGY